MTPPGNMVVFNKTRPEENTMVTEHADNPVMAQAAGQVETKHQQIHDLQIRLQKQLPVLAAHWDADEFTVFQHDYSRFDSECERVKQGLDMVHASLTGQTEVPIPPARRTPTRNRRRSPASPRCGRTTAVLPEGLAGLVEANAALSALLAGLQGELADSMAQWDDAARRAWTTAQTSWDESNRRQQDIVAGLPEAMTRAHGSGVWFPTTPAAS